MLGQKRGRVGADAEERRMAERDDAGIAEDEIERECEQREDRDFGQDEVLAGNSRIDETPRAQNRISADASAPRGERARYGRMVSGACIVSPTYGT
jgi:hypothetical protein